MLLKVLVATSKPFVQLDNSMAALTKFVATDFPLTSGRFFVSFSHCILFSWFSTLTLLNLIATSEAQKILIHIMCCPVKLNLQPVARISIVMNVI